MFCFIFPVFVCFSAQQAAVSLRVGLPDYPPVSYRDATGKPSGFCVELLELFASSNDWKLEYVDGSWNQCLERMRKNEIDILCGMVETPQREIWYNFSAESLYITWGKVFVRSDFEYRTVLQLDNRHVGVVVGDFYAESFKDFISRFKIECAFTSFKNYSEAFRGLKNGKVDAVVCESTEAIKYFNDSDVKNTGIVFGPRRARFGYSKDTSRDVINRIDRQLIDYRSNSDSAYYELYDKYFSVDESVRIPEWFWYALYGALSAAGGFYYRFHDITFEGQAADATGD